jgi:hypothetical protein
MGPISRSRPSIAFPLANPRRSPAFGAKLGSPAVTVASVCIGRTSLKMITKARNHSIGVVCGLHFSTKPS